MQACRVVLVRTEVPGNIGAAARVMRNFGLDDLVLVAPVADPLDAQARAMATHHAIEVLERARVVPDLEAALGDCVLAAATSAITGGLYRRQTAGAPGDIAPALVGAMPSGKVALVFGPEPHGLRNEEVARCHFLMHVPASEDYPALNLAQAVTICVYELHKTWRRLREDGRAEEVAPYEEQERMFAHLQQGLEAVRYLRGVRGEVLMFALRNLIARARPSRMEVRLLHGLARQLLWVANNPSPQPPPPQGEGEPEGGDA